MLQEVSLAFDLSGAKGLAKCSVMFDELTKERWPSVVRVWPSLEGPSHCQRALHLIAALCVGAEHFCPSFLINSV